MRLSVSSASSDSTTPLPIKQRTCSRRMPDGISDRMVLRPPITSVCPALWPPWKRATAAARSVSRSTTLPLPSSPHWVPMMTTNLPTSALAHQKQDEHADQHAAEPGDAQLALRQGGELGQRALYALRVQKGRDAFQHQQVAVLAERVIVGLQAAVETVELRILGVGARVDLRRRRVALAACAQRI